MATLSPARPKRRVAKAMIEVRCVAGKLHFMLNSQGLIEITCPACARRLRERFGKRYVVFHYWDLQTGELVATREFRDARDLLKGDNHIVIPSCSTKEVR